MHVLETVLALMIPLASFLPVAADAQSVGSVAFYNPLNDDGSMLENTQNGYGEPLNVIISGKSSPGVLTDDGLVNYARAIGFSTECLHILLGTFTANLGDGNGWVNQTLQLRADYGVPAIGTCVESLIGGNHFRMFRQNGTSADSGALFLAVSKEEPASEHHDIVPDGYDIGRDALAAAAIGERSYGGVTYDTQAQNITGLLAPGSAGVNHGIAQDGIVTLLTVTIV